MLLLWQQLLLRPVVVEALVHPPPLTLTTTTTTAAAQELLLRQVQRRTPWLHSLLKYLVLQMPSRKRKKKELQLMHLLCVVLVVLLLMKPVVLVQGLVQRPQVVVVASLYTGFLALQGADQVMDHPSQVISPAAQRALIPAHQARNHAATPVAPGVDSAMPAH